MELKKLLMSSGKEGVCGLPGSPKMEGAGKKGVAGELQVRGQKLLAQRPDCRCPTSAAACRGSELTACSCRSQFTVQRFCCWLAFPDTPPPGAPPLGACSAFSRMGRPFPATHTWAAGRDCGSVARGPTALFSRVDSSRSIARRRGCRVLGTM